MQIGCQTITFFNAGRPWMLQAAVDAVALAGFTGVEIASHIALA